MKKHRITALIIALILLVSIFAGCGNAGNSRSNVTSQATSGSEGDVQTLSIVVPVQGPVDSDNELEEYLSTLVPGLKVEIEAIEMGSYWDILNPRLASGEIPDVFHCHNDSMYQNYLAQNILYGAQPDAIKEYMPSFVEASAQYGAEVWSVVLKDGLVYGLPAMDETQTRPFTNAWRRDWLDAVGIEKTPETVEEYEEALTRLTFDDPDGNGINDTYGTTLRGKDATPNLFSSLFAAYGIFPNTWNLGEDGTVRFGITDPRAKEALTTLNGWFKKGLIDPEFTTVDGTVRTEKWANSRIGMLSDSTYYEVEPGRPAYEDLMALTPTAVIERGPAPKGENGSYGYLNWSKFTNKVVFGKSIANEDGKLEKFLQLWEIVNTDPDVYNRVTFGEEGIHWERQEDNAIVNIAPYNDAANRGTIGTNAFTYAGVVPTPAVRDQSLANNLEEQYKYAIDGTMKNGENYYTFLSKFSTNPEVDTAYNLEADTIYKTNMLDFITGARSLDEYDAFVKEWNAAGGDAYTEAYNEIRNNVTTLMDEGITLFG